MTGNLRKVIQVDDRGYKNIVMVKSTDPDTATGIKQNPPSMDSLDWEEIKRNIHNQLVDRKLVTYRDVIAQRKGVTGAVLAAIRKPLLELYKQRR